MRITLALVTGAFAVAALGCDDVHTGQGSDPSGPVELVRIMVQDAQPSGVRGVAVDLLDTAGSPLSTAVACSDTNPCQRDFVLQGANPDFTCSPAGVCNDPLAAAAAPIIPAETGAAGEAGGTQVRLVFDKLLNASFETVAIDPTQLPGSNKTYQLAAGVIEIDDPDGKALAGPQLWDPSGSPTTTSDPITSPFGPALVVKPLGLSPSTTYTIKVDASKVTDRKGNPMADQNGNVVSGTYEKTFTTEPLTPIAATTATDVRAPGVTLAPDDILQLGFNAAVDVAKVSCTVKNGAAAVPVVAWNEAGSDPTTAACMAALDPTILDLAAKDALGAQANWAAGDYTISCSITDGVRGASTITVAGTFSVAGAPQAGDPMSIAQHPICN